MSRFPFSIIRRPTVREFYIFLAFLGLTLIMTWPWVMHLRDAASDPGDPYFSSWVLWWDYHQTFHDPLHLFHGNIFYPYRYSLAFSEHDYGIALLFFPLFALGFRPLTIHGLATLCGFAFCGYGAFRLARTLTGSKGAAWVAGITFAFIPYRFGQLPHLIYLFAGWIPLLLEALLLFTRERTTKRAAWLGIAFFMNALTCVHWFVLTLIPLALTALVLLPRHGGWRDAKLWRRGLVALGLASVALIPFLLPYARAAQLYGFVRNPQEALFYSASPLDWLVGEYRNKMWYGLNASARAGEKALFPGLLSPLLALAAVFLIEPRTRGDGGFAGEPPPRGLLVCLDAIAIVLGILIITISGYGFFKLRVFGHYLLRIHGAARIEMALVLVLVTRMLIAYPEIIKHRWQRNLVASLRSGRRSDAFWLGVIWVVVGFLGSLGMTFFFHRFLYDYLPLFRSIRVPARWAMICYLGLALLAGLGAKQLSDLISRHWPAIRPVPIYVVIALALLIEQRVAPLNLIHGAVDPDALTLRFKQTPMAGGIVELPNVFGSDENYLYTLRAADHGRPLVTAASGFPSPIQNEIQSLTASEPVPDKFIDLLESIPCSYLVVHNNFLEPESRLAIEAVLARAISAGRVRFIRSYDAADLYAVTKTEPHAESEGEPPFPIQQAAASPSGEKGSNAGSEYSANPIDDAQYFVRMQYLDFLGREPDPQGLEYWTEQLQRCRDAIQCLSEQRVKVAEAFFVEQEFQQTGFFIYRVYKATLGRPPGYAEFMADRTSLLGRGNLEAGKNAFVESWIRRPQFTRLYSPHPTAEQFVDLLLKTMKSASGVDLEQKRQSLIDELSRIGSQASVLRRLVEDDAFSRAEYDRAFVLMQYFGYLRRDPDPSGYAFWVNALSKQNRNNYLGMVRAFITSKEYRSRFVPSSAN